MDLSLLRDERATERQLFALCDVMDSRDWAGLDAILAEDATGDYGGDQKLDGRADFLAMFEKFLGNCGPSQYLLGNIVIDVTSDAATSRCYVRDMMQGKGERSHLFVSSPGEYRDRWVRTAAGWRMNHCTKIGMMLIGSLDALGAEI